MSCVTSDVLSDVDICAQLREGFPETGTFMSVATRDDVISCYRVLLEREPESEAAIATHLETNPTVFELVKRFITGHEFHIRVIIREAGNLNFYYANKHHIDIDVTQEEAQRLYHHTRDTWARLGLEEPHWSVLTSPQYRRSRINSEIERAFYETGKLDVRAFLNACERNDVALNFAGTVLDLGSGIGRLGVHLSEKFRKYIGVDVSGPHLAMARERMIELGRDNTELMLLPEFLAGSDSFDTFVSLIALQHNPPPLIVELLHKILPRLNRGGIAFFQVPSVLFNYNFRLPEYLKTIKQTGDMEMHCLPQRQVFEILAAHNCQPVEVMFDGKAGDLGLSYTFIARKT
jgi:SAM-dependent methyltransferase